MWQKEFLIFLLCGGIAAVMNIGSRWLFSLWLPYILAICMAYVFGMTIAFLLFRQYVFKVREGGSITREVVFYILVNALALGQTVGISVLLADYLFPKLNMMWHREDFAHVAAVAVPIITSYLGHKYFTFRKKERFGR